MASFAALKNDIFSRQQRRQQYDDRVLGLNAYERHKQFMHDYQKHYGAARDSAAQALPIKTDEDTLRETYRFIRSEEDDRERTWEQRLAKRYHDKLFKEYCIADMSRYKENRIGLRWRTEKEVISGKGQFECGNKNCSAREGLRSYEVNFSYNEAGESKQALVKLRVCPKCTYKLNYRKEKELEKRLRKESRRKKRKLGNMSSQGRREKSVDSPRGTSSGSEDEDSSGSASGEDLKSANRFRRTEIEDVYRSTTKEKERNDGEFEPFFKDLFL